ncbi:MAG: hypothetical protein IBJ15_04980 [Alphaproteobacteria bacterium]|nr:hypothetical protein [Alphaproteobacteria bacterium]
MPPSKRTRRNQGLRMPRDGKTLKRPSYDPTDTLGLFDVACGVTGIPIRDGDEVMLIVIEPCTTSVPFKPEFQTRSDGMYRPVSLPIPAIYMDGGNFEPTKDGIDRAREFVAALNAVLEQRGRLEIADWQDFIEKNRERVAFPGKEMTGKELQSDTRPYHLYAVHRDIFDAAIQSRSAPGRLYDRLRHVNEIEIPQAIKRLDLYFANRDAAEGESKRPAMQQTAANEIVAELERTADRHLRTVRLCAAMNEMVKNAIARNQRIAWDDLPARLRDLLVFQDALSIMNRGLAPSFQSAFGYDHELADRLHGIAGQLLRSQRADLGIDLDQGPDEPDPDDEPRDRDDDDKPL